MHRLNRVRPHVDSIRRKKVLIFMLAVHRLRKKRLATRTSIDFLATQATQSSYETNFRLAVLSLRRQRIEKWLRENTQDKAGKSHKTSANVSRFSVCQDRALLKPRRKTLPFTDPKQIEEVRGVARGTAKRRMSAAACCVFERQESSVYGNKRSLEGRL